MLPLTDHNPRRTMPFVTYVLITINIVMFMWELSLGPNIDRALRGVAFIPARFWGQSDLVADFLRAMVSMFLHGGWLHLGGNMLYLWIFGDNVEDRLGHGKYAFFYILCGILATLSHAVASPMSRLPSIGASGAIAGVLGAYLVLYPHARVTTVIPIFVFITVREIPAVFVLGMWFVLQFFSGAASIGVERGDVGGVAYFAHIGGFVAGMILIVLMGGLRRRWPAR